jgi:hypothetical protein
MQIVRSWREQKVLLKRIFPFLIDKDFLYEEEKKESMLDALSTKLKKSRTELDVLFADLQKL